MKLRFNGEESKKETRERRKKNNVTGKLGYGGSQVPRKRESH